MGEEERQETTKGESGTDFLREGEYVSRDRKSVRQEPGTGVPGWGGGGGGSRGDGHSSCTI
jgi:hypothetical protein